LVVANIAADGTLSISVNATPILLPTGETPLGVVTLLK